MPAWLAAWSGLRGAGCKLILLAKLWGQRVCFLWTVVFYHGVLRVYKFSAEGLSPDDAFGAKEENNLCSCNALCKGVELFCLLQWLYLIACICGRSLFGLFLGCVKDVRWANLALCSLLSLICSLKIMESSGFFLGNMMLLLSKLLEACAEWVWNGLCGLFSFLLQDHFLAPRSFSLDFFGEQMCEVQLPLMHMAFKIWKLLDWSGFIWYCWRIRMNVQV